MRFVIDGMLGKLARWLRILGHDVKYSAILDDWQLIQMAEEDSRVLLTKDSGLVTQAGTRGIVVIHIEEKTETERLASLSRELGLSLVIDVQKSRCPKCNSKIQSVPKKNIVDRIQKKTFLRYDDFWECPECSQVYWMGAHWKRINKTLAEAKEILSGE